MAVRNKRTVTTNWQNGVTKGFVSTVIPARKGPRPKTIVGPLHIQGSGDGDPIYLSQLVADVLTWPHIEPRTTHGGYENIIPIRLEETATAADS